jgi:hypothetical protein
LGEWALLELRNQNLQYILEFFESFPLIWPKFIANSSLHVILFSSRQRERYYPRAEAAAKGGTTVVGKGRKL